MLTHVKRSATEFIEYLRTSHVGQEFLAQRREEVRAERRALIERDLALRAQEDALLKRVAPAVHKAETAYETALHQYTAASAALVAARAERTAITQRLSSDRAGIARELEALADERIAEAHGRINARFEKHRIDGRHGAGFSEAHAERLMAAIVAARAALQALQYTDENIERAVAAIEQSIPWESPAASAA